MSQNVETHKQDGGQVPEHLHQHLEVELYDTPEAVTEFLAQHYKEKENGKPVIEVYRTPGTFAHEYLVGAVTFDQVVDSIAKHGEVACLCCMDERIQDKKGSAPVVSSHKGCGAAGIVAGMVSTNEAYRANFAKVVGEDMVEALLEELQEAQASDDSARIGRAKDAFGAAWSEAVVIAVNQRGGKAEYAHLDVDFPAEHHTSMAVLDASGNFMGSTPGELGKRAFFISNPEHIVEGADKSKAYQSMLGYGLLAVDIARGHSALKPDQKFTIAITRDENFDQGVWDQLVAATPAASAEAQQAKNFQFMFVDSDTVAQAARARAQR